MSLFVSEDYEGFLTSSELLRRVRCFDTDCLGLPITLIFKCQEQNSLTLEDWTDM